MQNNLTVAIAVATYNGEKYIIKQLQSLFEQTQPANEVLICDDCSTDNTVALIEAFIEKNSLENWKLIRNDINKGYVWNFLDCASSTTSDLVFYCDQDDIWRKDKIEIMTKIFENKEIDALSCSYVLMDEYDKLDRPKLKFKLRGKSKLSKVRFEQQLKNNRSAGLTLAIRRNVFLNIRETITKYNLTHDIPIGLICSLFGSYYILDEELVYRRVHVHNVSEPIFSIKKRITNMDRFLEGSMFKVRHLFYSFKDYDTCLGNKQKKYLYQNILFLYNTIELISEKKRATFFGNLIYFNKTLNIKIVVLAIYFSLFGRFFKLSEKTKLRYKTFKLEFSGIVEDIKI